MRAASPCDFEFVRTITPPSTSGSSQASLLGAILAVFGRFLGEIVDAKQNARVEWDAEIAPALILCCQLFCACERIGNWLTILWPIGTLHGRNAPVSGLREPIMMIAPPFLPLRAISARLQTSGRLRSDFVVLGADLASSVPKTLRPIDTLQQGAFGYARKRGLWCRV